VTIAIESFFGNLVASFENLGIALNFDFLTSPTQFRIPYYPEFDPDQPVWQMILVGIKNTFLASICGIILASVIGLVVGVSRLSENWLVARLATIYVETFRNIPPLVIIIFFGFALFFFGPFPVFADSWEFSIGGNNVLILNKDRWGVPGVTQTADLTVFWLILVVGVIAAVLVWRWRTRVFDNTGEAHHRLLWSFAVLVAAFLLAYFATGTPVEMSWPAISADRRLYEGGFAVNWGFIALTVALGLYTASHIGEIIRGSILAIHSGQSEAANAVALSAFQRYRFVILPQALRIALPPTINQYLNLVKNTSLGTAVAYAELTALTKTSIGNGRPTFQSIIILMAVYLSFSLIISLILNIVNRRFALVER
jgi:general L-amino acid transport system permease protein